MRKFLSKLLSFIKANNWSAGYFVTLILIAIITHWAWFDPMSNLFFHDWKYRTNDLSSQILNFGMATWTSFTNLGSANIQIYSFISTLPWGVVGDYALATKVTHFWPIALLSLLGPYILFREITHGKNGLAFLGALVYGFNTYLVTRSLAHLPIAVVNALLPMILFSLIRLIKRTTLFRAVIFSTLFSLGVAYDVRVMYIVSLIIGIYIALNLDVILSKNKREKFIFSLPVILILVFGFYWLLPTLASGSQAIADVANRGLWGNDLHTLLNALSLSDWSWSFDTYIARIFTPKPILSYLWFIPIISFFALFHFKHQSSERKRNILWGSITLLLGLTLAKQVDSPFPNLYEWLYKNLPTFSLFREASKFYILLAFGYSLLFVHAIEAILTGVIKKGIFRNLFIFLTILILFINAYPLITQKIGATFVSQVEPSEYAHLTELIKEDPRQFRTLWVPTFDQWGYYDLYHPRISLWDVLSTVNTGTSVLGVFSSVDANLNNFTNPELYKNIFSKKYGPSILNLMGVKYVVIPKQLPYTSEHIFPYAGNREDYVRAFDDLEFLEKIASGSLDVYENTSFQQSIFTFTDLRSLNPAVHLEEKYDLISSGRNEDFFFVPEASVNNDARAPLGRVSDVFQGINFASMSFGAHSISSNISLSNSENESLLYVKKDASFKFLSVNAIPVGPRLRSTLSSNYYSAPLQSRENIFSYLDSSYNFNNIIPNPSFEDGLWQKKVSDCHNYDGDPRIKMQVLDYEGAIDGKFLQLEAQRHDACVSVGVPVKPGAHYLLSFSYQSPNAKTADYYVGFNDSGKTKISESIDAAGGTWRNFSKEIIAPKGSTSLRIYLYARESDGAQNNINRYDDLKIVEIPDISSGYYVVSDPGLKLKKPVSLSFDLINPTKKMVHVKGAKTPFFLGMNESYHSGWQLRLNNAKVQGVLSSWWPFAKPDVVANDYHYQLDGFLNTWYVDVSALCANENDSCIKNADGSYDIEMQIEFTPQRWFYLGLLVSGATLVGCLGYLGYEAGKRLTRQYKKKNDAA